MNEKNINIYHLLTYGNAVWPVSRYGSKQIFIWGPTGIGDTVPKDYFKHYSFGSIMVEAQRHLVKLSLPYNLGFIKRCKNADLIMCKNLGTIKCIPKNTDIRHFTSVMLPVVIIQKTAAKSDHLTRFIVVGKLDAWRGFDLASEAFKLAWIENKNIRLDIIGNGRDYKRLSKLISKLQIANYTSLVGNVSYDKYHSIINQCDVVW